MQNELMSGEKPSSLEDNQTNRELIPELQSPEITSFWLSGIIESAEDAIISKTVDGIINSWNKGAERLFGYAASEIIGKPITILIPPDRINEEPEILIRLKRGEPIGHFETVRKKKDGTLIDISLSISPIKDAQGNIMGVSTIARDISSQKKAETRKRFIVELDELVRPLSDPNEIIATLARILGEHLDADRCAYAEVEADEDHFTITGDYTKGDMPSIVGRFTMSQFGKTALQLMRINQPYVVSDVETDERITKAELDSYRRTQIRAVVSISLHKEERFVAGMAVHQKTPRYWSQDDVELVGYVANRCWESIERARAVRNLLESEERFRTLAESAPALIWINGADAGCDFVNRAYLEFFGKSMDEVIGFGWQPSLHPDDAEAYVRAYLEAFTERKPFRAQTRVFNSENRYRWIDSYGLPHYSPSGAFLGYVGTSVDITDIKNAEAERERLLTGERKARKIAEEASRLKDEFLAIVSHELRSPLNAILGWTTMLKSGKLNEATVELALDTVERNARAQNQLIEDLLDVSRIITGKVRLDVHPVNLSGIIEAAINTVKPTADAKSIRIQSVLDPKAGPVAGDSERMQQIVWNLLSNALKFTQKGGKIQIRLEQVNSHVEIIVSDNGIGIEKEFLPFVFDRFRQADSSSTRRFGGLGLGLAIVRHITELHGGSAEVYSEGENKGATFVIKLPLMGVIPQQEMREHPRVNQEVKTDTLPDLSGVRILAVDDDADTRALFQEILQTQGAEVSVVATAQDALNKLEKDEYDLLVSDIEMPVIDGYELIELVRQTSKIKNIPAIAITAYARTQDRIRAISAGYQMHVPKPIEVGELVTVIKSLIENRAK